MASAKLYLDTRGGGNVFPLKVRIMHNQKNVSLNLNIKCTVEQWSADQERFTNKMPDWKNLNDEIGGVIIDVRNVIRELTINRKINLMNAVDIKNYYEKKSSEVYSESTFVDYYKTYIASIDNRRTQMCYEGTLKKVIDFAGNVMFEDLNHAWLSKFDEFMKPSCPQVNSRSINLRNIRAVLYSALDNEVTSIPNPFRKFRIKSKKESDTYPLTIEQFIAIKNYQSDREAVMIAKDVFLISFYLMGINMSDVYNLTKGERCRYERSKTHKIYDIGIQPEAREIIDKYEDAEYMFSFHTRYSCIGNFTKQVNLHLKIIGREIGVKDLHTYHARHTWATFARSLRIPKDVISECLGHSVGNITDVYARFDGRERDRANRKVLDAILKYDVSGEVLGEGWLDNSTITA